MSFVLAAAESTDLFVGTVEVPRQVLRATLSRTSEQPARLTVVGAGVAGEAMVPAGAGVVTVEVGLTLPDVAPGTALPVTVGVGSTKLDTAVVAERPGHTLHLVSHFRYDPVWWDAGSAFGPPSGWVGEWMGAWAGEDILRPLERNGFALADAHLDLALRDPDYTVALAGVDWLEPYLRTRPERKSDLRRLLDEGRVEVVGGMLTEPGTNLCGAETTIRTLVHGIGYQRDILGADPANGWQPDAFGHDPQVPSYLAAAGLTGTFWARGPYHQGGPVQRNFGAARADASAMQFPSEFEWIAPSGAGVLTHVMPHPSAGWWLDSAASVQEAELAVYAMYRILKPVAATSHLLLPVGAGGASPNRWVTAVHRSWNAKYVWPRFVCSTPREFLAGVRGELAATGRRPSPQTRDMNPVYTGKEVTCIDTKQAQRAGEVAATDAEKLATVAALLGLGRYPDAAMDRVWRLLAHGAHQNAVVGSESDQAYVDVVAGGREAYDLAAGVRDAAVDALVGRIDTRGDGDAVVVLNTLSFDRTDLVRVPGCPAGLIVDDQGTPVPAVRDRGTVTFRADDVPSLGWRTYRLLTGRSTPPAWTTRPAAAPLSIGNERFRVTADPRQGGGLTSLVDVGSGRELLRGVGNELRLYDEYATHPELGEGVRHLMPRGPVLGSSGVRATTRREVGPLGERLVSAGTMHGLSYEQTVTSWYGLDRLEFRTRVINHACADQLLRVRFPVDLPGALPVAGISAGVVGRGYALPEVDAAAAPWTMDGGCHAWFALGCTARVRLVDPSGAALGARALGVADVVVGRLAATTSARDLVVALARAGVTATTSSAHWARYGRLSVDSNLPDFRIVLGGPEENAVARELLARADAKYVAEHDRQLAATGRVLLWIPAERPLREAWRPNADLRHVRALPALLVVGPADEVVADLDDAVIEATGLEAPDEPLTDATVALLTYGLPGCAVDPTGAMYLSLLRSCTDGSREEWADPPARTAPDGSAFRLQHWTHDFAYALVTGAGDWRALGLPARGQEYSTRLLARRPMPVRESAKAPAGVGTLPATHSFVRLDPAREVMLSALKPAGNPIASGRSGRTDPSRGVMLRLVESTGTGRRAVVGGALGFTSGRRADLLENPGEPTGMTLDLRGFETATVVAVPDVPPGWVGGDVPETQPGTEPETQPQTQPENQPENQPETEPEMASATYARYWLHGRGPA
ncbi:MAG TPA: glycoside hydrolase, partial [Actinopolymorphaceae bacterium]|nr:glycoside hydrolase [Actinopolymorphaceae bacterium]